MLNLLVSLQVAGMGETAVTDRAAEWSLSCVDILMDIQLALAHKALPTKLAAIGSLSAVASLVLLKVRLQEEALGAAGAAVGSLHGKGPEPSQLEARVGGGSLARVILRWSSVAEMSG